LRQESVSSLARFNAIFERNDTNVSDHIDNSDENVCNSRDDGRYAASNSREDGAHE